MSGLPDHVRKDLGIVQLTNHIEGKSVSIFYALYTDEDIDVCIHLGNSDIQDMLSEGDSKDLQLMLKLTKAPGRSPLTKRMSLLLRGDEDV